MKKLFVLGLLALVLVGFSVPVMAEVKIGGIVFTDFYYLSRNKESAVTYGNGDGRESYSNTRIDVPGITRLNARWTNEDNVGMFIEFGMGGGGGATDVSVRHAYGWWDITPGFQLLAGHTTTPFSPLNPSQLLGTNTGSLNIIGCGYGEFYSGRFPQVRATFTPSKMFGIAVAVVDPNGGARFIDTSGEINPADYQTNTKLPRVDVGAHVNIGPVKLYPSVLWQQRTFDKLVNSSIDDDVQTYAGSLGMKFGMGPFMLSAEGQYGKNWGNTRGLIGANPTARNSGITVYQPTAASDTRLDDTTNWGYWVDLAFKFGPVTPHLIFGQMSSAGDDNPMSYKSLMYGISVPIQLAKGFSIRPEFMWYDDGDSNTSWDNNTNTQTSVDSGSYGVYGVQFQITF